jgi:Flp pilus assembly protein TadG
MVKRNAHRRGAAYAEFLVAFMPVLLFAFCIFQESELFTGKLLCDHAAVAAARSASVVLPDNPQRYGGEGVNSTGPKRTEAVRVAAIRALAPFVHDGNVTDVQVDFPGGVTPKGPLQVRVVATFRCKVALTHFIACNSNGTRTLTSTATLPNQGAQYTYEGS